MTVLQAYSPATLLPTPASLSTLTSLPGGTPGTDFTDDLNQLVERWQEGISVSSPAARQPEPKWAIGQDDAAQLQSNPSDGAVQLLMPDQHYLPGRFGVALVGSVFDGYTVADRRTILARAMLVYAHAAADLMAWTGQAFPIAQQNIAAVDTPCLGSGRGRTYTNAGVPQPDTAAWPLGFDLSDANSAGYAPAVGLAIAGELARGEYSGGEARTNPVKVGSLGEQALLWAAGDVVDALSIGGGLLQNTLMGGGGGATQLQLRTASGLQLVTGPMATGCSVAGLTGTQAEAHTRTASWLYVTPPARVLLGPITYADDLPGTTNKTQNTIATRAWSSVSVVWSDTSRKHRVKIDPTKR